MHKLPSRRALLAGAPAATAAILVGGTVANAVAIGAAKAGEVGADAELLSLKPEVDDVLNEWIRQFTKDCLDHREFERMHLAHFGFERDDAPEVDRQNPEYIAYDRELMRLIHEHHSGRSEDELDLCHWDRLTDKLYPLAEKVLSYNASTLDGLRLQTRTLIIYHNEIWNLTSWSDDESNHPMCGFFESLCSASRFLLFPRGSSHEQDQSQRRSDLREDRGAPFGGDCMDRRGRYKRQNGQQRRPRF
jgi:hypothetical protein